MCVKHFNDETTTVGDSMRVGLKYMLPLFGFGLLSILALCLGLIMMIIPGIVLMIMWYVGAPVIVVEGGGVSDAFSRSVQLTEGYKGWILLFFLLLILFSAMFGGITGVLVVSVGFGSVLVVTSLVEAIAQMGSAVLFAAAVAAVYYELRFLKEGIGPESIAAVFD